MPISIKFVFTGLAFCLVSLMLGMLSTSGNWGNDERNQKIAEYGFMTGILIAVIAGLFGMWTL